MEFVWYFLLYGIIIIVLSILFFIDDRRNNGAKFKCFYSITFGLTLITCVFSSIVYIEQYGQFWLLSRRIISGILLFIQYMGVVIIHYGYLKTLYNDWDETGTNK